MILLINLVLGIILAFVTSSLKKYRETVQGEIFCGLFYLIEVLECVFKHSIRIYSGNILISIIIIILLPFIIFFIYSILKRIIESKVKSNKKVEEE